MSSAAIIVAAGKGSRFSSSIPKQYLKLKNIPIFLWSIIVFKKIPAFKQIILVVSKNKINYVSPYAKKYGFEVVAGGKERFDSVKAGLLEVGEDKELIAIHDAARPLIDKKTILECFNAAKTFGAAIVAVPARDTVKKINESLEIEETIPRNNVWLAQTPQIFQRAVIMKAYAKSLPLYTTDDSQLVEKTGKKVKIIRGSFDNLKITIPEDLKIAELMSKNINHRRGK